LEIVYKINSASVGKTTYIKLLLTGTFTETNEKVIKENIVLDASKFGIKYYNYPIELIDCSGIYDKDELAGVIKDCNVVILMYDFSNINTFSKLKFELLPIFSSENLYSILVVGNKIDLLDTNQQKFVIEQDRRDIEKYQEDMMIDLKYFYISCRNYINISTLFSSIIESLIYPTHILYSNNNLNEKFIKALTRIYRIFDKERKGNLTKNQFTKIHQGIYGIPLSSEHFTVLTDFLKEFNPVSEVNFDNGISLENFIALNKASVQLNDSQIPWTLLRRYGYNDNLDLDENLLKIPEIDICEYVVELSDITKGLLIEIYGMKDLFYTCVLNMNDFVMLQKANNIDEWLLIWNCFTRINYRTAYVIFLYLGFDIDFNTFIKKIKRSEIALVEELIQKTIYVCFISDNSIHIVNLFNIE
jgi:Ras family protein T1